MQQNRVLWFVVVAAVVWLGTLEFRSLLLARAVGLDPVWPSVGPTVGSQDEDLALFSVVHPSDLGDDSIVMMQVVPKRHAQLVLGSGGMGTGGRIEAHALANRAAHVTLTDGRTSLEIRVDPQGPVIQATDASGAILWRVPQ